jgi:hypothetical protein
LNSKKYILKRKSYKRTRKKEQPYTEEHPHHWLPLAVGVPPSGSSQATP